MQNSYKDLIVWQKSIDLVIEVYALTGKFPKHELYGLTSQMRRAAVSIPSNIAEGRSRGTRKDFVNFLRTSLASGVELETQIIIVKRLQYSKEADYAKVDALLSESCRMLHAMINKLEASS